MNKNELIREPYFIIIRGPLGIGKTTISLELSKLLNATYISIDKVLEENGLDREDNNFVPDDFIKANNIILPKAREDLEKGKVVIFDGCFQFKEQIEHLIQNLNFKHFVFDLKAPVNTCIQRDKDRVKVYGEKEAREVFELVSKFDFGITINAEGSIQEVMDRITYHLVKK